MNHDQIVNKRAVQVTVTVTKREREVQLMMYRGYFTPAIKLPRRKGEIERGEQKEEGRNADDYTDVEPEYDK